MSLNKVASTLMRLRQGRALIRALIQKKSMRLKLA
jgi:hypothetical protein